MESTHFINNPQRLSKNQLQLHLQQKQKRHKEKYCLNSSTNSSNTSSQDNYQQQSQCPHFTSVKASPTTILIPVDIFTNHPNHPSLNHFATASRVGYCEHTSPSHHCASLKNHHYQSNSKNIAECTTECQYCNNQDQNETSVSSTFNK